MRDTKHREEFRDFCDGLQRGAMMAELTAVRVGGIVLAAGESRRMRAGAGSGAGGPKQVMVVGGRTLLGRAVEALREAGCAAVVVVLGAFAETIRAGVPELAGVRVVENPAWALGMGGSLRVGVQGLVEVLPEVEGALVTVCDQPRVGAAELVRLMEAWRSSGKGLAAAAYGGTVGVPALISRRYFGELNSLPMDAGAKHLFAKFSKDVVEVDIPGAAVDVDDAAAYEKLVMEEGARELPNR